MPNKSLLARLGVTDEQAKDGLKALGDLTYKLMPLAMIGAPNPMTLTPQEVRRRRDEIARKVQNIRKMTPRQFVGEAIAQINAGGHGATDAVTFGLADKKQALEFAIKGRGGTFSQRYSAARGYQKAEDRYEAARYPQARRLGSDAGTALAIVATDGLGALPSIARIAPQLPRVAATVKGAARLGKVVRPDLAAAATGATAGVVGQGASDALSFRFSSPQDYLSAAAGGAAGGLTTFRGGPTAAAIADAGVEARTKALLTGQPVSYEDVNRNALAAVLFGKVGNVAGRLWSDSLPSGIGRSPSLPGLTKGKLGEWLAMQKTRLYGDEVNLPHVDYKLPGGKTIADHDTVSKLIVEAKFGRAPTLSKRQKEAVPFYADRYHVDHFTPQDIGNAFGGLLGAGGAQLPWEWQP